jgi:hypothetical protein
MIVGLGAKVKSHAMSEYNSFACSSAYLKSSTKLSFGEVAKSKPAGGSKTRFFFSEGMKR